jgi:hypothetical protein
LTETTQTSLTQRRILGFWAPLSASWILMSLEGPFVQAAIARLPAPETSLAAFGIVNSLSVTIEAPVMMLLSTSTALSRDRPAYLVLRRFMFILITLLTLVQVLVAFTPLYGWLVPGLMGVPDPIAAAARPGMGIMALWSAAIGWRRFFQGLLIRFGYTRRVTYGTTIRLFASATTAAVLAWWGQLPGVWVGACALMAGVTAEALLVTWLVRPVLARHLSGEGADGLRTRSRGRPVAPLTMRRVLGFHTPLAATSLLTLLSQPLISAGLARMPFPEKTLAAWPVVYSLVFFARSFGLATQEVVIALTDGPETLQPLRRFSFSVATGAVLILALVAFTPFVDVYLDVIADVPADVAVFVVPGLRASLLIPGLTAVQSWLRALLMKGEATASIYQAMGLNLVITAVVVVVGVALHASGIQVAAAALTVAMAVELLFLRRRTQRALVQVLASA